MQREDGIPSLRVRLVVLLPVRRLTCCFVLKQAINQISIAFAIRCLSRSLFIRLISVDSYYEPSGVQLRES